MSDNGYFTAEECNALTEFSRERNGKRFIRLIIRYFTAEGETEREKAWLELSPLYDEFEDRGTFSQARLLTELLRDKKDTSSVRGLKEHVEKLIGGGKDVRTIG